MKTNAFVAAGLMLSALTAFNPALAQKTDVDYQNIRRMLSAKGEAGAVYEDWHDQARNRDIPVRLYMPDKGNGPFPVVIFSHGLGGTRDSATYLGKYWSAKGYICVAVQHAGSDSSVWRPAIGQGREALMQRMKAAANGKNLLDRAQDIKFVVDELTRRNQSDPVLKNKMDLSKIAMSGHSFGAGTSLAVAGQNFGQITAKEPRIKSAIYLCPPVIAGKAAPDKTYGTINIPGMLITGTEDVSPIRETSAEDRRIPYDAIKAPHQYLVNFVGADHGTFGGRMGRQPKPGDVKYQEMVDEITTKFLDATLKGDKDAAQWLDNKGALAYLGDTAKYEHK